MKITSVSSGLLLCGLLSSAYAATPALNDGQLAVKNQSGAKLYVYDYDEGRKKLVRKQALDIGATATLNMTECLPFSGSCNRIYVSAAPLTHSLELTPPIEPSAFNDKQDGNIKWSFAEYHYQATGSDYPNATFDLSFIEAFSYPMTIKFDDPKDTDASGQPIEYGLNSLKSIIANLKSQTPQGPNHFQWSNAVWNDTSGRFLRIVGPVGAAEGFGLISGQGCALPANPPAFIPKNILTYLQSFNTCSYMLDQTRTHSDLAVANSVTDPNDPNPNPAGWGSTPSCGRWSGASASQTGYTQALRGASGTKQVTWWGYTVNNYLNLMDKTGFFAFPCDNYYGEFTLVPQGKCTGSSCKGDTSIDHAAHATFTVYPADPTK